MKQLIIICSLFSVITQTISAQDSVLLRRYLKINLTLMNGTVSKGYLGILSDSSLGISPSPVAIQVTNSSGYRYQKINYTDMQEMHVRRKSSVGRGVFYGSMIGLLTGFVVGIVQGADPDQTAVLPEFFGNGYYTYTVKGTSAVEKGVAGAFVGGLGGAVIGGIVGALANKTFIIGGKKKAFTEMRSSLISKVYSTTGH